MGKLLWLAGFWLKNLAFPNWEVCPHTFAIYNLEAVLDLDSSFCLPSLPFSPITKTGTLALSTLNFCQILENCSNQVFVACRGRVAQSVERPSKVWCNSDVCSNPGRGIWARNDNRRKNKNTCENRKIKSALWEKIVFVARTKKQFRNNFREINQSLGLVKAVILA